MLALGDGSSTLGWATITNGPSGWRPARTSASLLATSSNIPPTWIVPASPTERCQPRHRARKRPVDLVRPWPVAVARKGAAIPRPQAVAGEVEELTCRDVEEDGARTGEVAEALHPTTRDDASPELLKLSDERVDDASASVFDDRPAVRVAGRREQERERSGERRAERADRVRRRPGDEGARLFGRKAPCEQRRRPETFCAKARHRERVRRNRSKRGEDSRQDPLRVGASGVNSRR